METDVILSDAVKWANEYEGDLFHALLCDAPYHLQSIVKRFGDPKSKPSGDVQDGRYHRLARGFMGKQWDGGDVAFIPETWHAFMNVLYPGAFGMAFASSRGWHRMAVAIEDAGFIIHPSIFGWCYGSGFPKATRVNHGAEGFDGHRYGLQALKPALEPIIVFQKPYKGKPHENITRTGAGVLNIEAGRIPANGESGINTRATSRSDGSGWGMQELKTDDRDGRWPANFILLDESAAAALDKQSGELTSGSKDGDYQGWGSAGHGIYGDSKEYHHHSESSSGGASRFFYRVQEQIDSADPVYYEAKAGSDERNLGLREMPLQQSGVWDGRASQSESRNIGNTMPKPTKNNHPTVKPIALARYLATLLLPPAQYQPRRLFVPFAGVASEMIGAMQAGWDEITGVELTAEYIPIAEARLKYWKQRGWQTELFPAE